MNTYKLVLKEYKNRKVTYFFEKLDGMIDGI